MKESDALEWLEDSGLGFYPTFVPYQRSPIAVREPALRDLRACWRVAFVKNVTGRCYVMDYYQRLEQWRVMPDGRLFLNPTRADIDETARGLAFSRRHYFPLSDPAGSCVLGDPLASEVLEQIALESLSICHALYEDWAREFGYDQDSRAGEVRFRRLQAQTRDFRDLVGCKSFERLYDLEEHS